MAMLAALATGLWPAPSQASVPLLTLNSDARTIPLEPSLETFLDPTGLMTVEQVEQLPATRFLPVSRTDPYLLASGALWMRFDAVIDSPQFQWRLTIPAPGIDDAGMSYRNSSGIWVVQRAGDSRPVSAWPQAGRYPVFTLTPELGHIARYYVQIHHARVPYSAMPRIVSASRLINESQLSHLLLGVYFGLAALVVVLAAFNSIAYRDMGFASYAVHIGLFAAAQGSFTGLAGLYWWPEMPQLNNLSVFFLPVAAGAAALWFVRTVTKPQRFSRALDWFLIGVMGLLLLVGLLDAAAPTLESFLIVNTLVIAGMLVLMMVIGLSLAEGDRHARWVALGFLPVLLVLCFPLLRNLGLIPSSLATEYGLMMASAVEAPILFYGLLHRVAQRREPGVRATTLRTVDPLTGLSLAPVIVEKLRQALDTARRYPHPFALLLVRLTNLESLQQHGREVSDRAMVMSAARIRTVAGPADTVARVGDSEFALLLEGPISAAAANDVATKILASGLRPSRELPDAESLLFHIAVGHLGNATGVSPDDAQACLARMLQSVRALDDGSPKAIRLVKL